MRIRRPIFTASDSEERFEEFEDTADFVFGAFGPLSRWSMPDIPGLADYRGKLIHSANWEGEPGNWQETVKDWTDKTVAIIGVVRLRTTYYGPRSFLNNALHTGLVCLTDTPRFAAASEEAL